MNSTVSRKYINIIFRTSYFVNNSFQVSIQKLQNISTEEHIIGSFMGKTLYSKTITASKTNAENQIVNHGIKNVDVIWLDVSNTFLRVSSETYPYFNTGVASADRSFVNNSLDSVSNSLNSYIITRWHNHRYSIPSGQLAHWNPYSDGIAYDGYTPIGIIGFTSNLHVVIPSSLKPINDDYGIMLHNFGSSTLTNDFSYIVLYIKNNN